MKGYPLRFEARLDEPLSRWLWIVKWLLALPHWIALAALWIAFDALTLFAFVAILFTGRYPRAIFDFNVGVLRWTWRGRTSAAARAPAATRRARSRRRYPAELDVPYPSACRAPRRSSSLWLLALPHWLVVAVFLGWWDTNGGPARSAGRCLP